MAKFRFELQNILEIKQKMETQAKQEFTAAAGRFDTQQKLLDSMYKRKEDLQNSAQDVLTGSLNRRAIEEHQQTIIYLDGQIEQQTNVVKRAELEMEKARLKMNDAVMERKTYDKLREKAFEEFVEDELKSESKAVDELTSYTYGQKAKG